MKFASLRFSALILLVCLIVVIARIRLDESQTSYASKLSTRAIRRTLIRKVLEQDHTFLSANAPLFNYVGRWVPTINQLRRDVSFPGAYVEFAVTNATSVLLQLRNEKSNKLPSDDEHLKVNSAQLFVLPGHSQGPPSNPVSLFVDIGHSSPLHFDNNAHGVITLLEDGNVPRDTTIKVTLLPPSGSSAPTLEFEGLWMSRGASLRSLLNYTAAGQASDTIASMPKRLIEVVHPWSTHDPALTSSSYPSQLATLSNLSSRTLKIPYCLTSTCLSPLTVANIYFRSGLPQTPHYPLPHHFSPPQPSILLLELGLPDYQHFLSTSPSTHAITKFNHQFLETYASYIKTIRANAYPYHTHTPPPNALHSQDKPGLGLSLNHEASYAYNSAPSTLPIFLLTPFTPSKTLRRILSHVIAETVDAVQKDGDRSTFWLDTSNWLQSDDFVVAESSLTSSDNSLEGMQKKGVIGAELTTAAHRKIAAYLALHLCPYLKENERDRRKCPFRRFDNYLGNLYVPDEASMGMVLEERKIALVREALGL